MYTTYKEFVFFWLILKPLPEDAHLFMKADIQTVALSWSGPSGQLTTSQGWELCLRGHCRTPSSLLSALEFKTIQNVGFCCCYCSCFDFCLFHLMNTEVSCFRFLLVFERHSSHEH